MERQKCCLRVLRHYCKVISASGTELLLGKSLSIHVPSMHEHSLVSYLHVAEARSQIQNCTRFNWAGDISLPFQCGLHSSFLNISQF